MGKIISYVKIHFFFLSGELVPNTDGTSARRPMGTAQQQAAQQQPQETSPLQRPAGFLHVSCGSFKECTEKRKFHFLKIQKILRSGGVTMDLSQQQPRQQQQILQPQPQPRTRQQAAPQQFPQHQQPSNLL